jgi:hypothetical protein
LSLTGRHDNGSLVSLENLQPVLSPRCAQANAAASSAINSSAA